MTLKKITLERILIFVIILVSIANYFVYYKIIQITSSSSLVSFYNLTIGFFLQLIATLIGAYYGFRWEAARQKSSFNRKVNRIASIIYLELKENLKAFGKYEESRQIQFKTRFWDVFQDVLIDWSIFNIINLTYLYKQLIHVNKTKKYEEVDKFKKLLIYVIEEYDDWYKKNPQAREVLQEAKKEFDKLKEFGFT